MKTALNVLMLGVVIIVSAVSLSACGRKALPSPPDGSQAQKTYPTR